MAVIELGGQRYITDGPILQTYVPAQSQPFRLTGITLRENDPSVGHYIFRHFHQGIGWSSMDRQGNRGVQGLRDATADTRFHPVTLGRLNESQTHASPSDHPRAYANFLSDFYGLFEQDYASGSLGCVCVAKWSPDTWTTPDCPLFNAASSTADAVYTGASTQTTAHTVQSTYGNRIVIAIVNTESTGSGAVIPSGVTYASAGMTLLGSVDSGDYTISLWYRVAPTTGTNNCVVTFAQAQNVGTMVLDYYFVNQSSPFGTAVTGSSAGASSISLSVSTSSGDLVIGGAWHNENTATTAGDLQQERIDESNARGGHTASEERALGTSVTWSAAWSGTVACVAIAVPLLSNGFIAAPILSADRGVRAFDMVVHKGTLVVLSSRGDVILGSSAELHFQVYGSDDGSTFTPYVNLPADAVDLLTATITRRNNFDDTEGKLLDFENFLITAIYDGQTSKQIEVWSTDDKGASGWTNEGNAPSDRRPHALLKWRDPFDVTKIIPILVTEYNVYKIDTANHVLLALLPSGVLLGNDNDGRGATVGQDGNLYLPLNTGRLLKVKIIGQNAFEIIDIGPPGDGFVSARRGHVNAILSIPERWLVVAYGGHASGEQASIWYIDYEEQAADEALHRRFHAWHSAYLEGNADIDLYLLGFSTENDGVPRLHFALENATSAEMFHIEDPFAHPNSGATINYLTSSIIILPTDDLGDPHTTSTFYTGRVDADDLTSSTSGEFIEHRDGVDGDVDTTNDRGDYLSGDKDLEYGASEVGVAGKKITTRLTLNRDGGDVTHSPKLEEFEILAENRLIARRGYSFTIDIEKTAKQQAPTRIANTAIQETIIDNLETVAESTTLSTFRTGQDAQTLIRVPNERPFTFDLDTVDSRGRQRGYRTGKVQVYVEEVR